LKEQNSIEQLADKYEVDPTQINSWKSEFLSKASEVFNKKGKGSPKLKLAAQKKSLTNVISRLKMENDFLKKKLS
jgi:transposase